MKIIIDNEIVKIFVANPAKILKNSDLFNKDDDLSFRWSSLLECLELGSLLLDLPAFDQSEPLFEACLSTLCSVDDTEVIIHVYDRFFAEILNQIATLPQINASFLIQSINEQRQKTSSLELKILLDPILDTYEKSLLENPTHTMHDLILYLAWDRMCVCMARLFDYQSTDPKFIKGISVLRGCLIESYQHITEQGRTIPGIYRMIESFLFYQMREENLNKVTDAEWSILSQSFQVLKGQDELMDCYYIDDAVIPEKDLKIEEENQVCYLSLDSPVRVNLRLSLAQYIIDKIKLEVPNWSYVLHPKKITYLEV